MILIRRHHLLANLKPSTQSVLASALYNYSTLSKTFNRIKNLIKKPILPPIPPKTNEIDLDSPTIKNYIRKESLYSDYVLGRKEAEYSDLIDKVYHQVDMIRTEDLKVNREKEEFENVLTRDSNGVYYWDEGLVFKEKRVGGKKVIYFILIKLI